MKFGDYIKKEYLDKKSPTQKSKLDYGGVYEVNYKESKEGTYYIFVLHPRLENRVHCLDLSLIEKKVFEEFFQKNRIENSEQRVENSEKQRGLMKENIRISTSFYNTKIKNNLLLTKNKPYKTLDLNKITTVKYIKYDND